jgi:uncharacterized protein YegP (UPF0339 family)
MTAPTERFTIYEDTYGNYRWRVKGNNGRVIGESAQAFFSRQGAKTNARAVRDALAWNAT